MLLIRPAQEVAHHGARPRGRLRRPQLAPRPARHAQVPRRHDIHDGHAHRQVENYLNSRLLNISFELSLNPHFSYVFGVLCDVLGRRPALILAVFCSGAILVGPPLRLNSGCR